MRKIKIAVDIVMIIIFAILLIPRIVPTEVHELLGMIIIPIVVLHLALNLKWLKVVAPKIVKNTANEKSRRMFLYVAGLIIALMVTIASGILLSNGLDGNAISHELSDTLRSRVMPALVVHRLASLVLMVFIVLHVKMHIKKK
ncbi:hypothetical protein FACS18948_2000 [Clostridia bacterium]|nr:hypothetical protein FACS18948_2000 [Clostridia bacterium]